MVKVFEKFEEIEAEIRAKVPLILYKYRDWSNSYNKKILTENELWFAHPKELNDPYDIRVPVRFNLDEVNDPRFFKNLKRHGEARMPFLDPDGYDFQTICRNQLRIIKESPEQWFNERYQELRNSNQYDIIGVFSLTGNPLNETMWAHYGANSKGFCIGFDTLELCREIGKGFGIVEYQDEPPFHSFINTEFADNGEMYFKHTKWSYEEEFRLLTLAIHSKSDRSIICDPSVVKEVIVGSEIKIEHLNEIKEVLKDRYSSQVGLYQALPQSFSYGLKKVEIDY